MLANIQALRAIAASLVVLHHAIGSAFDYGFGSAFGAVFRAWTACGVDLFFVISGFIMVMTQTRRHRTPLAFLRLRLARIVPTYWFFNLLLLTLYFGLPRLFNKVTLEPGHVLASFAFLSQPLYQRAPIVMPGWTLEYEMLFYAIFAASLFLPSPRLAMAAAIGALIGIVAFGGVDAIALEFALGIAAALAFFALARAPMRPAWGLALLAIGGIGLCASLLIETGLHRWLAWGAPSLLIVLGAALAPPTRQRGLLFFGDASYSLYLSHWFVTPAVFKALAIIAPGLNGLFALALCFCACLAFGALSYLAVERPLTRAFSGRISAPI